MQSHLDSNTDDVNSSVQTNDQTDLGDMEILHERLQACNITNYCFVNDNDSTDQYSPLEISTSSGTSVELGRRSLVETKCLNAIHVKSLVWKGVYWQSSNISNITDKQTPYANHINDSQMNQPFYFVTALRVQDKVDVKSLRALVKCQWPNQNKNNGGVLILQLAEQKVAEELTGFRSGSIPPAWHSYPLTLFIDDNIIEVAKLSLPSLSALSSGTNDMTKFTWDGNEQETSPNSISNNCAFQTNYVNNEFLSNIMLSLGSGSEHYSLCVSLEDLFNSSIYYHSSNNCSESQYGGHWQAIRHISSFSIARVEQINKYQTQMKRYAESSERETMQSPKARIFKELSRRAFNIAARKTGKVHEVKAMIEMMGDKFSSFMQVEMPNGDNRFAGELNKNALHYAAWKGDMETMTLLINTAKQHDGLADVLNMISTGEGNYGKTPIFYSITQCRDDAVLLLLSLGANLLIVNNKGQTPCSLAVNKLKKETCEFMFQMEAYQLKAGGTFLDYRSSHSDGQRYGDLDPRFIRLGDVNVDEDILEEMGLNIQSTDLASVDLTQIPLPRSVRVTSASMRRLKWSKGREDTSINKSRVSKGHPSDTNIENKSNREVKKEEVPTVDDDNEVHLSVPVAYKHANNIVKLIDGTTLDMMQLPTLNLQDTLSCDGSQRTYELIDDEAGLQILEFAVEDSINQLQELDAVDDNTIINSSWGLDCEWKPCHVAGVESPIAILQLSSGFRAFVIDVQSLLKPNVKNDSVPLTDAEALLSNTLTKLFSNPSIRILGFGIGQDLTKLAASFPHIPCFREFNAVIDLQALSRKLYPGTPKTFMSSLQKAVAVSLRRYLDKSEQCSDWQLRPLRAGQLMYASLDAAILPKLLKAFTENNRIFTIEKGLFFKKHSYLQSSYRFQLLKDDINAYRVHMGSIKKSLDIKFSRQTWPTCKQAPSLPEIIPLHQQALEAVSRRPKNKEKNTNTSKSFKSNPIKLSVLTGDLSNLPRPGLLLGYSKESVIERIVRKQVLESLPSNTYLQYNRRGGIMELGNTFLLFVNFGVGRVNPKYRNDFLDNGRKVTFTINQSRYEDGELLQTLLTPQHESMYYKKPILFFIRASTKDKFMFCGKAKYFQHEEKDDDLIDLVLELTNFEDLVHHGNSSDDVSSASYMNIVTSRLSQGSI